MQLCLAGKLDLGEARLWATCTSDDVLGFDPILANRKDQAFNAEVLYDLYKNQPMRLKAQASFHSVHSTLARYMHKMFIFLAHRYPLNQPAITLASLVSFAKRNWDTFVAYETRDKSNLVSSWRCEITSCAPSQVRSCPLSPPGLGGKPLAAKTTSAICQSWQLRESPTLRHVLGVATAADACGGELPVWKVNRSSCAGVISAHNADVAWGSATPTATSIVIVPVYRILTKEVLAALVILVKSLRAAGSDADVVVFINENLDLYRRIPLLVLQNKVRRNGRHLSRLRGG